VTTHRRDFDGDAYTRRVRRGPCFICEIVSGREEQPHPIVYRDDVAIAFFNRYPTLVGYCLVAPVEHREGVVDDFTEDEYLALQRVVRRVGRAVSRVVPTERLYVLGLGSRDGNAHVHWHVAPLPPGVPYEDQQSRSLMVETAGYHDIPLAQREDLAERVRRAIARGD
jgi:diadenosine tetraphosphate (Ap4A) HIT family hydrolase